MERERETALFSKAMFLVHHRAGETHPEALKTEAIIIWRLTASESQSSDHTGSITDREETAPSYLLKNKKTPFYFSQKITVGCHFEACMS